MSDNHYTDNLIDRYHLATDLQRKRGRSWYNAARACCEGIAADCGIALDRVAAVMAITSPDAKLAQNVAWTRRACEDKAAGRPVTTAGRYPSDQRPKVQAALDQRRKNPGQYVSGPKVSAFFRAIMGDDACLVIDRWAVEAAGGDRTKPPTRVQHAILTDAYITAATTCGETVRDFQAIVWIQARESTPRKDSGTVPKHYDF